MHDKGRRTSDMTTRIIGFKGMCGDDIPANSVAGQRFNTMSDLATKFDLYGSRMAQEKNAARAATERKNRLLDSIRQQWMFIRVTAIACEPQQPGISQNFNQPSSHSAESLLETARAAVAAATPLKPLFLSREMPENFLEVLTDTIQSYEDAVNDYNLHSANAAAARTLLDGVCAQALAVRRELDSMMRNKYKDDPEKFSLWATASHLEKPARKSTPPEPGNGNQPPSGGQS